MLLFPYLSVHKGDEREQSRERVNHQHHRQWVDGLVADEHARLVLAGERVEKQVREQQDEATTSALLYSKVTHRAHTKLQILAGIYEQPNTECNHSRNAVLPSFVVRSEEHTSELQSLMRISYAVFVLTQTTSP